DLWGGLGGRLGLLLTRVHFYGNEAMHRWTERDDIVALYLYKHGTGHIQLSLDQVATKLGMTTASMKMRIQNFRSLDREGGLANAARLSRSVYARFGQLPESQLRAKMVAALDS